MLTKKEISITSCQLKIYDDDLMFKVVIGGLRF